MSETAPVTPPAPPTGKTPIKKKARKPAGGRESTTALVAAGYDVENNSRIRLGLKSLVSKGTLVQTKGTGASGSFKLNKKAASGDAKPKAKKAGGAAKPKKAARTQRPK